MENGRKLYSKLDKNKEAYNMKHFEHPQLIKRTDGEPLSSLKTRDSYKVVLLDE